MSRGPVASPASSAARRRWSRWRPPWRTRPTARARRWGWWPSPGWGRAAPATSSSRGPGARHRRLLALAKRVHMAQSRREPVVLLFEDLHWIDDGSAPFVGALVDAVPGTRALLLLNFRPEYHAGWMQKSYYRQLPLSPLGAAASAELLRDLLGADPSVAGLTDRIQERAGGNPFFTEELVQGLVETGSLEGTRSAYRLRT